MKRRANAALEVHEHSYVRGPNANRTDRYKFSHSHEGGDKRHQHPDTGPAAYTIDKDEWRAKTGLIGGGRKSFTVNSTGVQLPIVELEDWQQSFDIVIVPPSVEPAGSGPGVALPLRLALGHGMTIRSVRTVKP